jgi:hypothetical protein
MSITKPNPKALYFSKGDRRILLKYLEKFYTTKLFEFKFGLKRSDQMTKTRLVKYDRHYRLQFRSIEHLLSLMGSDFMKNVSQPNFRKTTEINARRNGLLQSEGETIDN